MKIFLSHSSKDKSFVREFRDLLQMDTWLDEEKLLIGEHLKSSIQEAIKRDVDFVIIFFSTYSIESTWVKQELQWALEHEKILNRIFVLPVLLDDVWKQIEPVEFQNRFYVKCLDQNIKTVKAAADEVRNGLLKLMVSFIDKLKTDGNNSLKPTFPQFRGTEAFLLAGGVSRRWRESIPHWVEAIHKSCAALGSNLPSLIQLAVDKLGRHGISTIHVAIPNTSYEEDQAKDEMRNLIKSYLRTFINGYRPNINYNIDSKHSLVESISEGLKHVHSKDPTIVAYSDILWPDTMIEKLMAHEGGDIVILIDKDWEVNNYPPTRTFHNKLYAELVFSHDGKFTDAGELIRSYPDLTDFPEYFKTLLHNTTCLGEVVGLFKFSKNGRDKFIKFCSEHFSDKNIPLPNFSDYINVPNTLKTQNTQTYDRVLFATFLAYFAKSADVSIEIEVVSGLRWFEIDFWQDAERVQQLYPYWDQNTGLMRHGAPSL